MFEIWIPKLMREPKAVRHLRYIKVRHFFPKCSLSLFEKKIISWFQNHGIVGFVYSSKLKDRHMAYFTLQWKQNKDYFLRLLKSSPYIFCRKALQLVSSNTKKHSVQNYNDQSLFLEGYSLIKFQPYRPSNFIFYEWRHCLLWYRTIVMGPFKKSVIRLLF